MIQINLLPDVKQEYLRARQMRNLAISISIITGLASVGVVVLLLVILGVQAGREALADNGIKSEYSTLSSVEGLSELVTLQQQLETIDSQHAKKSMDSRLFRVLQAINPSAPNDAQFTAVLLDPKNNSLRLQGISNGGYPAVEALKKTIENTNITYFVGDDSKTESISTKVEIGESSYGVNSDGRRVLRFEVFITHNELLFSNKARRVEVIAPDRRINVTDSRIGVPDSLFTNPAKEAE